MSYKTKKVVSEYDFYPLRVTKDDFFILSERYKTKTLTTIFASLKRFYYWILQDLQGEYIKDFEAVQEFRNTDNRITTFLSQFPSRNEIPSDEKIIKKEKSFLTRKQMIFVKNRLNNDPRSHKPHRDSVVWELCCVTGIRPTELPRIKIEYFNLDENGFLSLNNRNWGILDIPREISKQEQSPSHELYKTPIPFHTVLEINKYLKKVYRLQDKEIPKGKGYLFRPKLNDINKPYSGNFVKDSIKRIKHDLNFLTDKQKDDFELKASRRSLNNLIMGYDVELPNINRKVQEIAANYQMRHTPARQSIAEKHYTDAISEDNFYNVLEHTINFPWNYNGLAIWETKHGYKNEKEMIIEYVNTSSEEKNELSKETEDLITKYTQRLSMLKTRPKNMNVLEWTTERGRLIKHIEALKN